jgi:glycosyltransferase involved in cell wall biosynthesis
MSAPLVSVVVSFLNPGRFLEEAIESVLNQDYPRWELLLIDDGTTDESAVLARRCASRYPDRVRRYQHAGHRNRGLSASRNLGIRQGRGELFMFLDADDVWLPGRIAHQVSLLERHPKAEAAYGATEYWRSWTGELGKDGLDEIPDLGHEPDVLIAPGTLTTSNYPLGTKTAPSMNALCVRRSTLKRVGGFIEQFTGMYEDQAFLAKLYLQCPIVVSGQCYDRYRLHPASICAQVSASGTYDDFRLEFLRWLQAYFVSAKIENPAVRAALEQALEPYRS